MVNYRYNICLPTIADVVQEIINREGWSQMLLDYTKRQLMVGQIVVFWTVDGLQTGVVKSTGGDEFITLLLQTKNEHLLAKDACMLALIMDRTLVDPVYGEMADEILGQRISGPRDRPDPVSDIYIVVVHLPTMNAYLVNRRYTVIRELVENINLPSNFVEEQDGWHCAGCPEWAARLPQAEFHAYWLY